MCSLLHEGCDLLNEDAGGWVFAKGFPVCLGGFAGRADENAVVGSHARVDHADIGANDRDSFQGRIVDERGGSSLLGSNDDGVGCFDAERGRSLGDGC